MISKLNCTDPWRADASICYEKYRNRKTKAAKMYKLNRSFL